MPDRPQCIGSGPPADTPKPSWEDVSVFREVFLSYLPPPAADSLRQAGRFLYDAVLEHDLSKPGRGWLFERVRAVTADLRFGAQVLGSLSDTPVYAGVSQADLDLSRRLKVWAGEVVAVLLAVEGALASPAEPGALALGLDEEDEEAPS